MGRRRRRILRHHSGFGPFADKRCVAAALVAGLLGTCPAYAGTIELTPEAVTIEAPRGPASVVDPPDPIE